jgi:hypothetical protein
VTVGVKVAVAVCVGTGVGTTVGVVVGIGVAIGVGVCLGVGEKGSLGSSFLILPNKGTATSGSLASLVIVRTP